VLRITGEAAGVETMELEGPEEAGVGEE